MRVQTENSRICFWDNIKGILIFLTVFAHILYQHTNNSELIRLTVNYIYMFHMPAFAFVSGFFGKSEQSHSVRKITELVFLCFIFNSIMGFIFGFTSLLQPVYSYWYLIALIVWRFTAHHIAKFKTIVPVLIIIALFSGFYPSIDNTFAVSRIIGFYPYYMCGFLLGKDKAQNFIETKYSKRLFTGLLTAVCTVTLMICANHSFQYKCGDLQMDSYTDALYLPGRAVLYVVAFGVIDVLMNLSLNTKIPFITEYGKNSLWIFILHRPFTLFISHLIKERTSLEIITISAAASVLLCFIFGNSVVSGYMNSFMKSGADIFTSDVRSKINPAKIVLLAVSLNYICFFITDSFFGLSIKNLTYANNDSIHGDNKSDDIIYPVMTDKQVSAFEDAFRITFAGDLILLEDQVKRAYNGEEYDFKDVFEYAKPYISSADLALGVFEGPMAGKDAGYSSSNFDDSKELKLNFPDSFAWAVKDAGFDLVTTANNHILDKGEEGALRTIDVLEKTGLNHTGSYKNDNDRKKNHVKIIESQGLRFAVLSYTYGANNIDISQLTDGRYSYLTSVISGTEGKTFEKLKQNVYQDFQEAKAMEPDIIMVLPHIGTQFSNEIDREQEVWTEIFRENGADIILGDHPHVVEPVVIEKHDDKNVFTAYCPGNFANIYRENQGDTSMLVDIYIDRKNKEIIGGSIVPLYTHARADGNYRAVPVYEMLNNASLRAQLTTDDINRAAMANKIISQVVFGNEMDISSVTERYYFDENGFIRSKTKGLVITDEMKSGILYTEMEKANSVCFIGDSVTEGSKNGGCPWYEPIEEYFPEKEIYNYSKGGCTVSYMLNHTDEIPDADLYVIALGTNDVRYRDPSTCAMTSGEFVEIIDRFKQTVSERKNIIFIAPWYSTDGDQFCDMSYEDKTNLNDEYSFALKEYCRKNSLKFISANEFLKDALQKYPQNNYLLDHIHPNSSDGVVLYSTAVLSQ